MNDRITPRLALFAFLFACTQASLAGTTEDYHSLRAWCISLKKAQATGKQGNLLPPPRDAEDFRPYCEAYAATNALYTARRKVEIKTALTVAMNATDQVIAKVAADHYLLPEVHALRGKAYFLAKDHENTERALQEALRLDPRHVGAHATLADLYLTSKRTAKAVETVRAGLALDPEQKSLRRIARKLGVTYKPPTAPAKRAPVAERAEEKASVARAATPPQDAAEIDKATPTAIGSAQNPWCRFCTDIAPSYPATSPSTPGVVPTDAR